MHDLGEARLIVEVQALLGAPGQQMQMAPDRPEESLGPVEPAVRRREQARLTSSAASTL